MSNKNDDELNDVDLQKLSEIIINGMKELGINADFLNARQKAFFVKDLISVFLFGLTALIITVLLVFLVDNGNLDSTAFSTILAVIVGAVIDRFALRRSGERV